MLFILISRPLPPLQTRTVFTTCSINKLFFLFFFGFSEWLSSEKNHSYIPGDVLRYGSPPGGGRPGVCNWNFAETLAYSSQTHPKPQLLKTRKHVLSIKLGTMIIGYDTHINFNSAQVITNYILIFNNNIKNCIFVSIYPLFKVSYVNFTYDLLNKG